MTCPANNHQDLTNSPASGQGLIEAMLAVAVVMVVMYSLLNLGALGLRNSRLASDRVVATRYLQQGIELLRAQRDQSGGWSQLSALPKDTVLCLNPQTGVISAGEPNCYYEDGGLREEYLLNQVFERTLLVSKVYRAAAEACPNDCSACGEITSAVGGHVDDCSLKITVQLAWPGVSANCEDHPVLGVVGNKYCLRTSTILTNWRQ